MLCLMAFSIPAEAQQPAFFAGATDFGSSSYFLTFPDGNLFGYYWVESGDWIFHNDMGWEYYVDANSSSPGAIYFYDNSTGLWFYTTSGIFPFLEVTTPGALNGVWFWYELDPKNPGHYTGP